MRGVEISIEPSGTCRRMVPAARSTADKVPQGRRGAWQVGRRLQKAAKHPVRRASLAGIAAVLFIGIDLIARNESDAGGEIVGADDEQILLGVEGVAAPGHAAEVARFSQRALNAGWGEEAIVAQFGNSGVH